ncbi:MAG: CYTH domain-containing protein [Sulfuriflexus sp.]|nr:CYTH domain-containing protein [Sulfuriflexus sp.]
MAIEIERKFLLLDETWREQADAGNTMRQGYFAGPEASKRLASIRIRVDNEHAFLNIKSYELGISRQEYEYPIDRHDAEKMLETLCERPLVEKTRYKVVVGNHTWEIDVFAGKNEGLIVAEIELQDENESFHKPAWLGEEVSDDPRYYNVCLIQHPYKDW